MYQTLDHDQLRTMLIEHVANDRETPPGVVQTLGYLTFERPIPFAVDGEPQWRIAPGCLEKLTPPARGAVERAVQALQLTVRLQFPPLGSSASAL